MWGSSAWASGDESGPIRKVSHYVRFFPGIANWPQKTFHGPPTPQGAVCL